MNQRVLVTAGAGGIGRAIAEAFAANGDRVHVADVDTDAVQQLVATVENVTASVTDIRDPDDVNRLFADIAHELGGLDVLVNNAGIGGPTAPAADLSLDDWQAVVDVNLNGTFYVTQCAIPLLKESDAGSIVTMSSLAGRFGYQNRIAYSSTKWALVGFGRTLATLASPPTSFTLAPSPAIG